MFHSSSRHHIDSMFVILCVIAGATSHSISNSNRTSPNFKLHDRYKSSFISFLLDENIVELVKQPENLTGDSDAPRDAQAMEFPSASGKERTTSDLCAQLSSVLSGNQIKYCHRHYDIIESIVPQVIQLTKQECSRVTADLRWNCATIDLFLDRSSALAFTKEAALVRSILNASMMYLIVKTCSDHMHHSCGCQSSQDYQGDASVSSRSKQSRVAYNEAVDHTLDIANPINDVALNYHDLRKLETGSPLRLTRSMIRRQGCNHNVAFADALTGIFMDADDVRSLNKAHKILNENSLNYRAGAPVDKRLVDADYKDLSFIKWSKSAINLHNNRIGRQVVREAIVKQCRCHGVSGMCQFQTCWDQLHDFKLITTKLREIFLNNAMLVEVRNLGNHAHPDLYLTRSLSNITPLACSSAERVTDQSIGKSYPIEGVTNLDRIRPEELAYLYESPDYCDAQPVSGHAGTKGRRCDSKEVDRPAEADKMRSRNSILEIPHANSSVLGTCEYLCCNRGFQSELVLNIVECNCGFKFCCRVECNQCLRQQIYHYCR